MEQHQKFIYLDPFGCAIDGQTPKLYSHVDRAAVGFYNLILGTTVPNQGKHRIQSVCTMEPLTCIFQYFPCIF